VPAIEHTLSIIGFSLLDGASRTEQTPSWWRG